MMVQRNPAPPADDAPMGDWRRYIAECVAELRHEIDERDTFRAGEVQDARERIDAVERRAAEDNAIVRRELKEFAGGSAGEGLDRVFWSLVATVIGAGFQLVAVAVS